MLSPKRVKHRKQMRGVSRGRATRCNSVVFGEYGLMAHGRGNITSRQIEATRIIFSKKVRKLGKLWIRIFPDYPYTRKPAETRMGGGKGSLDIWVAKVKPGTVMFEIAGIPQEVAKEAMRLAEAKLPVRCSMISREVTG